MKQRILLILVIMCTVFFTQVQAQEQPYFFIKTGGIKNISIMDDIDVILVSGNNMDKGISMSREVMEKLEVRLEGQTLGIYGRKRSSIDSRDPLYIHVNELTKLTISGNVNLKTWGIINSENIDLFVSGNAKVQLRTTGKINAYPLDDSDITVDYIVPVQKKNSE